MSQPQSPAHRVCDPRGKIAKSGIAKVMWDLSNKENASIIHRDLLKIRNSSSSKNSLEKRLSHKNQIYLGKTCQK